MGSKNSALFKALEVGTKTPPAIKAERAPKAERPSAGATDEDAPRSVKQASREGKVNISIFLEPAYKTSLRAIQVKHPERKIQDMIAEALNDLFAKYDVTTIADERSPARARAQPTAKPRA